MSAVRKDQKRSTSAARPAKAPVSAFRRSMIQKINIAKAQLRMDEDDYRVGLAEVTGRASLTKCSDKQLNQVLEWLVSKGFRPVQSKGAATHPMARKARALWISLHHLGAVDNPSDHALEAFATRQLKCERLVWANQREAFRLIEALKSWAVRAGWPEAGKHINRPGDAERDGDIRLRYRNSDGHGQWLDAKLARIRWCLSLADQRGGGECREYGHDWVG